MSNITPVASFDAVPRLETATPALAGASGAMTAQAQALANRSEYTKQQTDLHTAVIGNTGVAADARLKLGLGDVAIGYNARGNWAAATAYAVNDVVAQSSIAYQCVVAHTSGTFATDLAAAKWAVYQGLRAADLAANGGSGMVGHTTGRTVGDAITGFDANVAAFNLKLGDLNVDNSGALDRYGMGGTADAVAALSLTSLTSRDGWGSGVATCLQVNRKADNVATLTNPLNHGIRVNSIIQAGSTAQVREWGITSVAEDFSDSTSVTVGLTGIGRRHFGGSRTWGGQLAGVCYLTGADLAASTANVYGVEIDIEGSGDDTAGRRHGAFIASHLSTEPFVHSGVVGQNRNYVGLRIVAQSADLYFGLRIEDFGPASVNEAVYLNTVGQHAVHIGAGAVYSGSLFMVDAVSCVDGFVMNADVGATGAAFKMASVGNYGFLNTSYAAITTSGFQDSTTTAQHGFYAAGTYSTAAFRMAKGEKFMLGTDTTSGLNVAIRFNDTSRAVEFLLGGAVKSSISII